MIKGLLPKSASCGFMVAEAVDPPVIRFPLKTTVPAGGPRASVASGGLSNTPSTPNNQTLENMSHQVTRGTVIATALLLVALTAGSPSFASDVFGFEVVYRHGGAFMQADAGAALRNVIGYQIIGDPTLVFPVWPHRTDHW